MANKMKPSLRYFTRFKGAFGYLRAVVRYDKTRKSILTPIVVTKEQQKRLDTIGHIYPITSKADAKVEGNLQEYTAAVWRVCTPLIASGDFDTIPSEHLTTAIMAARNDEKGK